MSHEKARRDSVSFDELISGCRRLLRVRSGHRLLHAPTLPCVSADFLEESGRKRIGNGAALLLPSGPAHDAAFLAVQDSGEHASGRLFGLRSTFQDFLHIAFRRKDCQPRKLGFNLFVVGRLIFLVSGASQTGRLMYLQLNRREVFLDPSCRTVQKFHEHCGVAAPLEIFSELCGRAFSVMPKRLFHKRLRPCFALRL